MVAVAPANATSCPGTGAGSADGATYSLCDFRNFDFSGLTRSGIDFSISYLGGATFENATFTSTTFGNANSPSVNFRGAHITSSSFNFADMGGSDFSGAVLTGTTLAHAHFENAVMENVDFVGATFNNVFLNSANLTGSNATQAQLDNALLTDATVCPDGHELGVHVGSCFSVLKPLTPQLSPITSTSGGFTFAVVNYNELYTFTAAVTHGPGVAAIGSPTGTKLPIAVTGVPSGSQVTVTVTSQIGDVNATSSVNYLADLADTGLSASPLSGTTLPLGTFSALVGISVLVIRERSRRRSSVTRS